MEVMCTTHCLLTFELLRSLACCQHWGHSPWHGAPSELPAQPTGSARKGQASDLLEKDLEWFLC